MSSASRFDMRTAFWLATLGAIVKAIVDLIELYLVPPAELSFDPDSNLRLQQVRDWMAGQSWFDVRLAHFGLEGFTPMHWTRVADLGPAALIAIFTPFVGQANAETIAVVAFPMLLRIPLLLACIWAVQRLVPTISTKMVGLAVLIVGVHLYLLNIHFRPGLIDHHNLQIIALVVFIGGALGVRTFRSGLISAAGMVIGLVVGFDAIPHVAAAILAIGLLWLIDPQRERAFLKGLGLGTIALTTVLGPVFIPQPWTTAWCDSWTVPIAAIMLGFGVAAILLAGPLSQLQGLWKRFIAAAFLGGGILASLLWSFPACRNPLPLQDPLIQKYWMNSIAENANALQLMTETSSAVIVWLLPLVAAVYYLYAIKLKRLDLAAGLPLLVTLAMGLVFGLMYFRGLPMLTALTLLILGPLGAQLLVRLNVPDRRAFLYTGISLLLVLVPAIIGVVKPAKSPPSNGTYVFSNKETAEANCLKGATLARVQALPAGLMIAGFGQSEYLLRKTHHTTAFAGYHRAKDGNLWTIRWLIAKPDEAKAMLKQHQPKYLAVCPLSQQFYLMARSNPDSLIGQAFIGKPPVWLKPVTSLSANGQIYEIIP